MERKPEGKIVKHFVAEIKKIDKKKYTVEATISDESVDRYKEVVLASSYTKHLPIYKRHPILLSSHDYNGLTKQIGEAEYIGVEGKRLKARFKYYVGQGNPEADWAFFLCTQRIASFSVGFIPKKYITQDDDPDHDAFKGKNKPRRVYIESELMEVSQVLVPVNASALQNCLRSDDEIVKHMAEEVIKRGFAEDEEGDEGKMKIEEAVKGMIVLLTTKDYANKEEIFKTLSEVYEANERQAPLYQSYKTVKDVIGGCLDAETAEGLINHLVKLQIDKIEKKITLDKAQCREDCTCEECVEKKKLDGTLCPDCNKGECECDRGCTCKEVIAELKEDIIKDLDERIKTGIEEVLKEKKDKTYIAELLTKIKKNTEILSEQS